MKKLTVWLADDVEPDLFMIMDQAVKIEMINVDEIGVDDVSQKPKKKGQKKTKTRKGPFVHPEGLKVHELIMQQYKKDKEIRQSEMTKIATEAGFSTGIGSAINKLIDNGNIEKLERGLYKFVKK